MIQAHFHPGITGVEIIVKNLGSKAGFGSELSLPWTDSGGITGLSNKGTDPDPWFWSVQ